MSYNHSKGRGKYTDNIELKYIQIPHSIFKNLYIDFASFPEASRSLALYHFIYHYFTNAGYESLKVKDINAYVICKALDAETQIIQNNARWKNFDEFYKGRTDLDFDAAWEIEEAEKKARKKNTNRQYYQDRKLARYQIYNPEEEKKLEQEAIEQALKNLEGKGGD